jgi:hypothetical protein
MGNGHWSEEPGAANSAVPENSTNVVQQHIKGVADFDSAADLIRDHLVQKSIFDYFRQLFSECGVSSAEAVNRADLDKDFGRQIINGERRTRRDNYIRIGIGIGLDSHKTQSMLKFVQTGQLYVLRQRDAAIMFCIERKLSLIDTQLMLDSYGYEPLGDGGFHTEDDVPVKDTEQSVETAHIEQIIKGASNFSEVLDKTAGRLIKGTIEQYFDALLAGGNIDRKELFERAGVSLNTGYQLIRGVRRSKNRDVYLRIAIAAGIGFDETQRMLKLLDAGAIYPLVERDAVIYFGMVNGYSLAKIQELLADRGFSPL